MKFKRSNARRWSWPSSFSRWFAVFAWNPDFLDRLERMTYDLRVRTAQEFPAPAADQSRFRLDGRFQHRRHPARAAGTALRTLLAASCLWPGWSRNCPPKAQKPLLSTCLFGELRPDHAPVQMADGSTMESDDFFALQMRRAGNVISAFTAEVTPPDLFATNCLALGDISTEKDSDGVLRRIKSFSLKWHPAFKSAAHQLGVDLEHARMEPDKIILPLPGRNKFHRDARPRRKF